MPNYPTHSRWGRIGAIIMALSIGGGIYTLFVAPLLAVGAAIGAGAATFVGAIYPDVDHHSSVPRRKAARAFRSLIVFGVLSLAALNWTSLVVFSETLGAEFGAELPAPPEVIAATLVAIVAAICAAATDPAIGIATRRHRGWTHSVPINLLLIGIVAAGVWLLTIDLEPARQVAAVAVVCTFFIGILIHLGLDGEIL